MKKNKGFTLVELLAVIAIVAILVIVALPNVIEMFNGAKESTFTTELKKIYRGAQEQYVQDMFSTSGGKVYSQCSSGCTNNLKMDVRDDLEYYIEVSSEGKVVKYYAKDNTFQFAYNGQDLLLTSIEGVQRIAELSEDEIISITAQGVIDKNIKLIETIEQNREGQVSVGDEIVINNTEHFFVISSDSNRTTLIAKYNLYVGEILKYENSTYTHVRTINSSDANYGMQDSRAVGYRNVMNSTDCIGVVGFSTDKYWLDGSNNVLSKYGGTTNVNPFYDINVYETSNTAPTIDCSSGRCYVTNSGYTIGYYVNQYTNKLKSYGVTIHEGRLLKTEEAGNLGCETGGSGYHCRGNSTQFMRNTAYWMEGLFDKNTVRAIQFNNINRESTQSSVANYGVRPVIVMNTSDIPLLPHEYFENKPVIAY